ncbi:hypothetical protein GGX14DRAFT_395709 [Mycena pura]|uniref:Uncharacterized protein n=1 Tax=Mycena pura TaxID=153505 RepID=A0AAD6VJ77_9AGAR|nr:hypothetical protein GGX14DRAFT_395709 [Mycena pura]
MAQAKSGKMDVVLDNSLTAIDVLKEAAAFIPVPAANTAVKAGLAAVQQILSMVSDAKGNKKDLPKLKQYIEQFTSINTKGFDDDSMKHLEALQMKLQPFIGVCDSEMNMHGAERFFRAPTIKKQIKEMKEEIHENLMEFIVAMNTSLLQNRT